MHRSKRIRETCEEVDAKKHKRKEIKDCESELKRENE